MAVERLRGGAPLSWARPIPPEFGHKGITDTPSSGPPAIRGIPRSPRAGPAAGAGAAVAAGLGPLGWGPTVAGPSASPRPSRIYGLKPSFGRVRRDPACRAGRRSRPTGTMTRTVRDAALMLDVLAGPDDRDRHSLPADGAGSYLAACDAGIAGLSVAWSADLGHGRVDPEVADLCAEAAIRFESLGCHVEVVMPTWDDPEEIFRTLASAEAFAAYRDRLGERALLDPPSSTSCARATRVTAEHYPARCCGGASSGRRCHRFLTSAFDLLITPTLAVAAFPLEAPPIREIAGQPVSPMGGRPSRSPISPASRRRACPRAFTARGCRLVCRSWAGATPIGRCSPPRASRQRRRARAPAGPVSEPPACACSSSAWAGPAAPRPATGWTSRRPAGSDVDFPTAQ